ncbi:hypothetical protein [Spiroplasma endosymbiont of Clivina fossor]
MFKGVFIVKSHLSLGSLQFLKYWTMPIQNWGSVISHLMIKFENRAEWI